VRSNQSNPIDLPDDPPSMECVECEEKFSPDIATYFEGMCPYCDNALTEDDDE